MKPLLITTIFLSLFYSLPSFAAPCTYYSGDREFYADISNQFTTANNKVGAVVEISKGFTNQVYITCPPFSDPVHNPGKDTTWRSYETTFPIVETLDSYKYIKVNEYLLVGTSISDPVIGNFYPPQKDVGPLCCNTDIGKQLPVAVRDRNFKLRFKVIKPFINFVYIPRTILYNVYTNTGPNQPSSSIVYSISYSGSISVPQNCIINTDQVIQFNFDKIGAQLFSKAGAGNKPDFVNEQTRNIPIKCTNIEAANAILTIRVQSENSDGDIITSSNPDVGFKMSATTNLSSTPFKFTPNDFNSRVPFKIDDTGYSNISVTAWPVSYTGNTPTAGIFTARGYLRVDYF